MFARRSLKEIDAWFEAYRATNLRLFTYPRPTVAAINGHAYAGGLITALDCDHRIAAEGPLQFSLNEVPIGIPMPAVYCEIIKHAVGAPSASELTLFGQVYDLAAAARMSVVQRTVAPDKLLDAAVLALVERPHRVLSREQLLDLARGRAATAFDRSIDTQVSRLRKKIELDPGDPKIIKTVWGGGYMLTATVSVE
jgi:enoyl-CoA hydratase/carnithine racemase